MVAEGTSTMTPPIPYTRLRHITNDVCESTFNSVATYDHSRTEQWNTTIIQSILQSLISETSTPDAPPSYKYAVNSTIIQHQPPSASASASAPASTSTPSQTLSPPPAYTASTSTTTDVTGANEASTTDETHPVTGGAADERTGAGAGAEGVVSTSTSTSGSGTGVGGARRGMHSATGAYWNTEKDGMWSYKYEGGEARGFDVVICVIWMAV